jgi:hypothetical protein
MSKRAFLVLGPESSGNRLVTRCLIAAGCDGDGGHRQRFDRPDGIVGAAELIVWRRSMPHGQEWPDLDQMLRRLRDGGYADVRVLAMVRTHYCAVQSQLHGREAHVRTEQQAEENLAEAMRKIAVFCAANHLPVRYITYESLVHHFGALAATLADWGLKLTAPPETIRDENKKYLPNQSGV